MIFKTNKQIYILNHTGTIIFKDYKQNNLYYLNIVYKNQESYGIQESYKIQVNKEITFQAGIIEKQMDSYKLWHLRLGHLGAQNL